MRILVLDNYDSFTYNLVQYVQELIGHKVDVFRNDAISLDDVDNYKDILGVCLGHQAIGEAFGGTLHNIAKVYHGVATPIEVVDGNALLFRGLPKEIEVGRYHSWIVERPNLPAELQITAVDEHGAIMAMRHEKYNVRGVQFHPESVLTPMGKAMLRNFLFPTEGDAINYTDELIAAGRGMA